MEDNIIYSNDIILETINELVREKKSDKEMIVYPMNNGLISFRKGEITLLAGRSNIGKTNFLLSLLLDLLESEHKIAFFTPGFDDYLCMRLLALKSNIPLSKLRTGNFSIEEAYKLQETASYLFGKPFYLITTPNINKAQFSHMTQNLVEEYKVDFIIVDSFEFISELLKFNTSAKTVSDVLKTFKTIAVDCEVPILYTKKLNLPEDNSIPCMEDLKNEVSTERYSDNILFLHRDRLKQKVDSVEGRLIVGKSTSGYMCDISCNYNPNSGLWTVGE